MARSSRSVTIIFSVYKMARLLEKKKMIDHTPAYHLQLCVMQNLEKVANLAKKSPIWYFLYLNSVLILKKKSANLKNCCHNNPWKVNGWRLFTQMATLTWSVFVIELFINWRISLQLPEFFFLNLLMVMSAVEIFFRVEIFFSFIWNTT